MTSSTTAPAVYTLFSGSSGNSVYIRYGETEILIDAGVSAKAITEALVSIGTSIDNIAAIFVTHEHCDHVRGLNVLLKKHPIPVHMTAGVAGCCALPEGTVTAHRRPFSVELPDMTVSAFATPHDSAGSVGYIIRTPAGKIGLATDIGHLSPEIRAELLGCESVILEANYDPHMLMTGPYPYALRCRIASDEGHLSNDESAVFASELAKAGTKNIMLAHLSKENNHPELAYLTVQRELTLVGCEEVNLVVARRERPTRLCE